MAHEQNRVFARGDARMVYTRSGEGASTFVLIHGIGMGHRVFRDLAEALGAHGTVYAVDLPGFGDSPEPGSAQPMSASGDLIADFVRTLALERPVLVGHSMGCQVVVECVVRHPELTDCVVLIAPTVNRAERTALRQTWRLIQDLTGEHPKVLALGLVQYIKAGPRWFIQKMQRMLEHRIEDVLPRVSARALVLRGETDKVCPEGWVRFVADSIPDAEYREIPGHGHEAMIQSAEPVASMIIEHCELQPGVGRP